MIDSRLDQQFKEAQIAADNNQFDEAIKLYTAVLDAILADPSNSDLKPLQLKTLLARAELFRQCNMPKLALNDYESWYNMAEPGPEMVAVIGKIAGQHLYAGSYEEAITFLRKRAYTRLPEYPHPAHEATIYRSLGAAYVYMGQFDEALKFLNKSIPLFKEAEDHPGHGRAQNALGVVYLRRGELDKAITHFLISLEIYRKLGDIYETAIILNNLGECYQCLYDMQLALAYHQEALQLVKQVDPIKSRLLMADLYRNIGVDLNNQGKLDEGIAYINRALGLCQSTKQIDVQLQAMASLALAEYKRGNLQLAESQIEQAIELAEESNASTHLASVLYVRGLCHQEQGDNAAAEEAWQKAISLAQEAGQNDLLWQIHTAMARQFDGELAQAHRINAVEVINQIADPIADKSLRERFLTAEPIQAVLQS